MTVKEMKDLIASYPDDMCICLRYMADTDLRPTSQGLSMRIWYEYETLYADGVQEEPTEFDTMPKDSESSFPCLVLGSY